VTGPEHYKAAEQAIERALGPNTDLPRAAIHAQLAQAHAALAGAAAAALTAAVAVHPGSTGWAYANDDINAWEEASGTDAAKSRADRSCA
jgi:hypothetical protein